LECSDSLSRIETLAKTEGVSIEQLSRGADLNESTMPSLNSVWLKVLEKPGSYQSRFVIRFPTGPNGFKTYEVTFPIKIRSGQP
jgi:hypothetical protein